MHVNGQLRFFQAKDIVRIANLVTSLTPKTRSVCKNQTTSHACIVLVIGINSSLMLMEPAKIVQNARNQTLQKPSVRVYLTFYNACLKHVTGIKKCSIPMVNATVVENVRSQHGIGHYVSNQQTTTSAWPLTVIGRRNTLVQLVTVKLVLNAKLQMRRVMHATKLKIMTFALIRLHVQISKSRMQMANAKIANFVNSQILRRLNVVK